MRRCALALWKAPQQGLLRMRRRRSSEETQLVELSPAAMANHVGETYFPLIHAACSSIAFMAVVHRHGWAVQRPEADVGEAAVRPRKGCQRGRVQTSHQRTPRQGCASPPFPSLTAHPSVHTARLGQANDSTLFAVGCAIRRQRPAASPPNPNALRSSLGDRARCDRPAPGLEQGTSALVRSLPPCDPPCRTTSAASRMRWSSWRASWSPPEATAARFIRKAALCCCVRTVRRMRQVKHQSVLKL